MNPFSVVSECCPVGCATPVFLAQSQKDALMYSYCWSCGVLWRHPLEARSNELDEILDARDHQPDGFHIPTDAEVVAVGLDKFVLYQTADEHCRFYFESDLAPALSSR